VLLLLVTAFAVLGGAAAFVVMAYRRHWHWTGLPAMPDGGESGARHPYKTLWDWMQLLIIPLGLAVVAFGLNLAQSSRDARREERAAVRERSLAADGAREEVLRAYVQQISDLMLARALARSPRDSEAHAVARTLTLTALRRLDGARKGAVVQFLSEADLIEPDKPDVDLTNGNLRNVVLRGAYIDSAELEATDMRGADLRGALIGKVNFALADLRKADFRGATAAGNNTASRQRFALPGETTRANFLGRGLTWRRLQGCQARQGALRSRVSDRYSI
jgi:hypothetical protein